MLAPPSLLRPDSLDSLLRKLVCRIHRAVWVGVTAGALAACTATAPVQPEQIPGAAAEQEIHRLAHTRLQLGAMHFSEGRNDVALGEVARALQAYPQYVDAYNLQGWIYLAERNYPQADASFERALSLRPGDADIRYNLGWSQCQQKNFDRALQYFDNALADPRFSDQGRARTLLAKATCLRQAQPDAPVLALLHEAYELDPGSPAIELNYAQALFDQGDTPKARFYAQRLNNSEWASAASLWLGMRIERKLGDAIAVRQLADQLLKRFPASKEREKFDRGAFDE